MSLLLRWAWAIICGSLIVSLLVVAYFVAGILYQYVKLVFRLLTDR